MSLKDREWSRGLEHGERWFHKRYGLFGLRMLTIIPAVLVILVLCPVSLIAAIVVGLITHQACYIFLRNISYKIK